MQRIVIIGSSGQGANVLDAIEKSGRYDLVGFVSARDFHASDMLGYPYLGVERDLPNLVGKLDLDGGIIAVGDNWTRYHLAQTIREMLPHFAFVNVVHPSAQMARRVFLGDGVFVGVDAVLNTNARVGDHCIIGLRASIDHDCTLGSFSSVAPNATLGGTVSVGHLTAVALGARIIHGITIGKQTVVGSGAVVVHDIPDCVVAYGVPARVVRTRAPSDRYL